MIDEAALPLRLKECLLCFKDKILRAGFTEERVTTQVVLQKQHK